MLLAQCAVGIALLLDLSDYLQFSVLWVWVLIDFFLFLFFLKSITIDAVFLVYNFLLSLSFGHVALD